MSETIIELDTMLDQSNMRSAITEFPNQINKSFSIMSTCNFNKKVNLNSFNTTHYNILCNFLLLHYRAEHHL